MFTDSWGDQKLLVAFGFFAQALQLLHPFQGWHFQMYWCRLPLPPVSMDCQHFIKVYKSDIVFLLVRSYGIAKRC